MSVNLLPSRFFTHFGGSLRRPAVTVVTLLLLGGIGNAAAVLPKDGMPRQAQAVAPLDAKASSDFAAAWARQPRTDFGIPADGAKVVVVKFNDYQCPGCAATHAWYRPVLEKFEQTDPGAVKYVVKDWPWNSRCNANFPVEKHPAACEGAAAVRMARDRGKAKELEMQEWLCGNQATLTPRAVKDAAARILGVKNFDAEYARKLPSIKQDVADGMALHIGSTPTIFINGVRIDEKVGLMPAQVLRARDSTGIEESGSQVAGIRLGPAPSDCQDEASHRQAQRNDRHHE